MKDTGKKTSGSRVEQKVVGMLKALLCAYVITGILLLVLTGLLYKLNLDESKVTVGIIVIYVLSTFIGGFVVGKLSGERKFIWGLMVGIVYFILLLLVSVGLYHSLQGDSSDVMTTFFLCAGGGMLGGMLS